jgi:Glycosyl transferase family 2
MPDAASTTAAKDRHVKVSILIPCFNAELWIAQAIRSALEQTWPHKEVVVVDDGSTDDSLAVIRSFGDAIRFESGPNRGGNVTRNRLLELAGGDWLQYLDADDYLLPEKIERQFGEFDPASTDIAYSPVILEQANPDGEPQQEVLPIPDPHDPWAELIRWTLPQTGTALWRRSAIVDVGGWKNDQNCCQEHELYLRLLSAGKRFQFCPTPGAVYRQWSTQTVCRKDPLTTFRTRLAIMQAACQSLQSSGGLNDSHRDALVDARLECARSMYLLDRDEALRLAAETRDMHPGFNLPAKDCFPTGYRWVFRFFGFRTAESVATLMRPWRRKTMRTD